MMHEVVNTHRKTCAINTHRKKRAPFDKRYQLVKRRYSVQACFPRRIPHSFLLDLVIGAALRCSVSSLALLALLEVEAASSALLVVTAETWVERFDRRGTEPFEPFEPFEFFQNSGTFPRKFKNFRNFQHFLNYRRNSDKISSKSEQKSVKRIQK